MQHLHIHDQITNATKTVCNPASSANLLIGFSDMPNGSATCHACNPVQIKNKILRGSRYELLYWIWMGQHGQHTWKNKIPMGLSSSVQKFYWKPTWPHPWKIFFKIIFASRRRILVLSTPRGFYIYLHDFACIYIVWYSMSTCVCFSGTNVIAGGTATMDKKQDEARRNGQ